MKVAPVVSQAFRGEAMQNRAQCMTALTLMMLPITESHTTDKRLAHARSEPSSSAMDCFCKKETHANKHTQSTNE